MLPARFFHATSHSLVKKYLTPALYDALQPLQTAGGFTLDKAIRSGIQNPDSHIGIYAGDAESYRIFSPVFDPIIREYHNLSGHNTHIPDLSVPALPLLDPKGKYVLSSRIRVARNVMPFSFPPHISKDHRKILEKKVMNAADTLSDELKGRYLSLEEFSSGASSGARQDLLIFGKGDRFQDAAGINSDFPDGRGIFYSNDGRFIIWVNEEDHLRIMSIEKTSDLAGVFQRLCKGLQSLETKLKFASDTRYGYLTACPTNLGTAMRAGVHIRLEKLEKSKELLHELARDHKLQIRGTHGEKTRVKDAVFDISNTQRLGITESAILKTLHAGILAIIRAEESL